MCSADVPQTIEMYATTCSQMLLHIDGAVRACACRRAAYYWDRWEANLTCEKERLASKASVRTQQDLGFDRAAGPVCLESLFMLITVPCTAGVQKAMLFTADIVNALLQHRT